MERPQVGVDRVEQRSHRVQREQQVRAEVEAHRVVRRVLEHLVAEEAVRSEPVQPGERRRAGGPSRPAAGAVFRARHERRMHELAPGRAHAGLDVANRLHLLRREAGVGILAGLAQEHRRIELALARIVDHAVLDAVDQIAGICGRLAEDRRLGGWDVALRVLQRRHRIPEVRAGVEARPVVGRVAGDEAVEVLGIALRLHQTLLAALGAADVVGVLRRLAVIRARNRLAVHGRHVRAAMAEIGDEVRPAEGPRGIERAGADVAGVGARSGITARKGQPHRAVADDAGRAAVADHLELAIPAFARHPHFELHSGRGHADDAANRSRNRADGVRIHARRQHFRERDRRIRNAQLGFKVGAGNGLCRQRRRRYQRPRHRHGREKCAERDAHPLRLLETCLHGIPPGGVEDMQGSDSDTPPQSLSLSLSLRFARICPRISPPGERFECTFT